MLRSTAKSRHLVVLILSLLLACWGPAVAAGSPDPGAVVTLADVEKLLGGQFNARSPEPGALFYEEEGGSYRQVNVYLWPADGKTVASVKEAALANGEPVDDVSGIGDAAMYRPQGNEVTVEKKAKNGEAMWLSVAVHGAKDAAETKRFAVELAKRGAAKL